MRKVKTNPHQNVSGTIINVLDLGTFQTAWRGLLKTEDGESIIVKSDIPLPLEANSFVRLKGKINYSGNPKIPDELLIALDDPVARISMLANISNVSVEVSSGSQEVSDDPEDMIGLGVFDALSTGNRSNVWAISRLDMKKDESLTWVANRFNDSETNQMHKQVALFNPIAMLPKRKSGISASVNMLVSGSRSVTPVSTGNSKGLAYYGMPVENTVLPTNQYEFAHQGKFSIPYNPLETGVDFWHATSMFYGQFMPRLLMSAQARAQLSAAQEMARNYLESFGYQTHFSENSDYDELALANASTAFADVVAVITYIIDTGDEEGARAFMYQRALSVVQGAVAFATANVVSEAIRVAKKLEENSGDGDISLKIILATADKIVTAHSIKYPDDIAFVCQDMAFRNCYWMKMPAQEMSDFIRVSSQNCAKTVNEPDKISRLFTLAAAALAKATFSPGDLIEETNRLKALSIERKDLIGTADNLRSLGLGKFVPILLANTPGINNGDLKGFDRSSAIKKLANIPVFGAAAQAAFSSKEPLSPTASILKASGLALGSVILVAEKALAQLTSNIKPGTLLDRAMIKERAQLYGSKTLARINRKTRVEKETVGEEAAFNPFQLGLDDRIMGLCDLVLKEQLSSETVIKQILSGSKETSLRELNTLRGKIKMYAFSIRADSDAWARTNQVYSVIADDVEELSLIKKVSDADVFQDNSPDKRKKVARFEQFLKEFKVRERFDPNLSKQVKPSLPSKISLPFGEMPSSSSFLKA